MRKRPRAQRSFLGIRQLLAEKNNSIHVQLVSGREIWLSKKYTKIKLTDYGQLTAEIPRWYKDKIKIELRQN
jgi:hypothetical protein